MKKKRPNFVIVENADDDIEWDDLKRDYLNPNLEIEDICKKYGISRKKFYTLKKRLVEETGVHYKPTNYKGRVRHYRKGNHIYRVELTGKHRVVKNRNGKSLYFGDYDSLEDAREVCDLMEDHNWDKDYYLDVIKPKYHPTYSPETPKGFEKDFFEMKASEIMKKYNLSYHQYYAIVTPLKQRLGMARKPRVSA